MRCEISVQRSVYSQRRRTRVELLKNGHVLFSTNKSRLRKSRFYITLRQGEIDCFCVDGFCSHINTVYEALFWFYRYCHRQEVHSFITGDHNNRGSKNKQLDEFKRYLQEKELSLSLKCGSV